MKRFCFLLGILFLIAACGTLPKVDPVSGMLPDGPRECRRLFFQGRWQLQHAIVATLPGGQQNMLMGISIVSAGSGSIRSILMTIEGLVVFEAEYDRDIRIVRAVSPFDSDHFAQGLINDLRLIFFMPEGALVETGRLQNGSTLCRYRQSDRLVVDIVRNTDDHWELRQYSRWFRKKRTVDIFFNDNFRFNGFHAPSRLTLTTFGYAGYTLDMDLIEAVSLEEHK
ncbi:MAG: hypothetical protein P1P89_11845 [Desulfobacterales bacterium]|nr:hypothetical protein [Desulfobacterales bacterium]